MNASKINNGRKNHKNTDIETQIEKHACLCYYKMRKVNRSQWRILFATLVGGHDESYIKAVRKLTDKKLREAGKYE